MLWASAAATSRGACVQSASVDMWRDDTLMCELADMMDATFFKDTCYQLEV